MKKLTGKKSKYGFMVAGAVLIAVPFCPPASADDASATAYTMAVVEDDAYGDRVTSGKYDLAISQITRRGARTRNRFADQNNLCVAYVKSTDLDNATAACNAAVAALKKQERWATSNRSKRDPVFQNHQSNLAVALSNRGVLLAVRGQKDRAKSDFLAAISLQTRMSDIFEKNLDRLGRKIVPEA